MTDLLKDYRFVSAENPPAEDSDYVGFHPDKGLCLTDFMGGVFYPEVTHYLVAVDNPLDKYAEASVNESINYLEAELGQVSKQGNPRDLFAAAALVGEFISGRGLSPDVAAQLAFRAADEMLKVREVENG